VKAEVEKSKTFFAATGETTAEGVLGLDTGGGGEDVAMDEDDEEGDEDSRKGRGEDSWLEISIEIPGMRDDDALPIFLSAMLREALLAEGGLKDRLWINRRFHWRLYVDVGHVICEVRMSCSFLLTVSVNSRFYYSHNHSHIHFHFYL
jgi:exosome complex component RRP42